jgi:hypothetical protein
LTFITTQEVSMSTQLEYGRRSGWVTFAALVMFAVSFVRLISAINYFADGSQVSDLTNSLFGDNLWVWGVWDIGLAGLGFLAGLSLLGGGSFGRWVAYIWAVWVTVQSFLIIGLAPWFAAAMIVLGGLVIYGLASTSASPEADQRA